MPHLCQIVFKGFNGEFVEAPYVRGVFGDFPNPLSSASAVTHKCLLNKSRPV
jgi:hypothetical protein